MDADGFSTCIKVHLDALHEKLLQEFHGAAKRMDAKILALEYEIAHSKQRCADLAEAASQRSASSWECQPFSYPSTPKRWSRTSRSSRISAIGAGSDEVTRSVDLTSLLPPVDAHAEQRSPSPPSAGRLSRGGRAPRLLGDPPVEAQAPGVVVVQQAQQQQPPPLELLPASPAAKLSGEEEGDAAPGSPRKSMVCFSSERSHSLESCGDAPPQFRVLEAWDAARSRVLSLAKQGTGHSRTRYGGFTHVHGNAFGEAEDAQGEQHGWWQRRLQRLVVQPHSRKRLCWESVALLLILFEILVVPLQLLADPVEGALIARALWAPRVFWTIDIAASLLTGYVSHEAQGMTEMRPAKVARKYASTRLPFDLFLVACDWLEFIVNAVGGGADGLRHVMLLRATRPFRLLRIAKTSNITDFAIEQIRSEVALIGAYVLGILFVLVTLIHIIACVWYAVHSAAPGASEPPFAERYVLSFHYVLALFVGEQLGEPADVAERLFAIVVLVFAFVVSASLVGSLTTAMTRLQIIASQRSAQFAALGRYLSDCNISHRLSVRVQRHARHAFRERKRNTPESSVELIGLISDPLRAEIHYEVHSPLLTRHPFFGLYNTVNPTGVRHLCHTVVAKASISRGDVLFSEFEVPAVPKMCFIESGRLFYNRALEQATVSARQWVSEAALWTTWAHRGTLVARTECQLVTIDATRFVSITASLPTLHANAYALRYVAWLNDDVDGGAAGAGLWLTDVGEDNEAARRLVLEAFREADASFEPSEDWVRRGRSSILSRASLSSLSLGTATSSVNSEHSRISSLPPALLELLGRLLSRCRARPGGGGGITGLQRGRRPQRA